MSLSTAWETAANFAVEKPLHGVEAIDATAVFWAGVAFLVLGFAAARFALPLLGRVFLAEEAPRTRVCWTGAEVALVIGVILIAIQVSVSLLRLLPVPSALDALLATDFALLIGSAVAVVVGTLATRRQAPGLGIPAALDQTVKGMGLPHGVPWRRHGKCVLFGAFGLLVCVPMILGTMSINPLVLEVIGYEFATQDVLLKLLSLNGPGLVGGLLLATLVGPALEEVLFRGFIQPLAAQSLGPMVGVLLTSVFFGLIHGTAAFLPVFALSLVLGYLRHRTGYLLPAIIAHCLWNAGTMVLTLSGQISL